MHVNEDYTPLVELIPHPRIIYNDETMEKPYLLRKSVAKRLFSVADNLPDGLSLKVYSTFRSKEKQNILWKETVNEIRKENPNLGTAEIINMAQYKTNDPKHTMGGMRPVLLLTLPYVQVMAKIWISVHLIMNATV